MNFKKILVTLLASALLLSACGKDEEIIGGADGPTAVVVAERQGGYGFELFSLLLITALIIVIICRIRKRKK